MSSTYNPILDETLISPGHQSIEIKSRTVVFLTPGHSPGSAHPRQTAVVSRMSSQIVLMPLLAVVDSDDEVRHVVPHVHVVVLLEHSRAIREHHTSENRTFYIQEAPNWLYRVIFSPVKSNFIQKEALIA